MAGDYRPSGKQEITMEDFKDSDKILKEKIENLGKQTEVTQHEAMTAEQQQSILEQQVQQQTQINQQNNLTKKPMSLAKPSMQIDKIKQYSAILSTTEGDIEVSLSAIMTPITVNNFVYLAQNKFYDNTIFHRVIDGFMIQGGDPIGNGTGGPGYKFDDEPFDGSYSRGTIAMANSGANTNGSQFFIMHKDYTLPKNYVIFGKVIKGIEVVDKIAQAEVVPSAMGENSTPINPVTIKSIVIVEK
ncbi:MAG: peptidylprolyl isomerase [Candidatus Magasanikbacteria bacterium]|nr:peptidylprolyl isomerase [Candidatus Magasanikbacteria bacterium]